MSNRRRIHMSGVAWLVAACGLALPAMAQGAPDAAPADAPPPVLEGPKAARVRPPGVGGDFGGGEKMGKDRVARRPAPMRAFWEAVQVLDREDTPDALRLAPEQHEQFEALMSEQRERMRAEMETRMKERGASGQGRGPGPGPGPDARGPRAARPDMERPATNGPDMNPDERRAMREERERARPARPDDETREMRRGPEGDRPRAQRPDAMSPGGEGHGAPNAARPGEPGEPRKGARRMGPPQGAPQGEPSQVRERVQGQGAERNLSIEMEEMQTRAWSILNEAQRALVRQELDRIEAEQLDAGMDQRVEQYLKKRRDGAAQGGVAPEGGFADKARQTPDRRAEIAKKLSEMTPEERKAAIERLRSQPRRERGEPRPAPPVEKLRDPE